MSKLPVSKEEVCLALDIVADNAESFLAHWETDSDAEECELVDKAREQNDTALELIRQFIKEQESK